LYYESLCPYCHYFFLLQLAPTYEKLRNHIEVELIPSGVVRVSHDAANHTIIHCQHGDTECYGNRAQACGLEMIKDKFAAFEFVKCNVGAQDYENTQLVAER